MFLTVKTLQFTGCNEMCYYLSSLDNIMFNKYHPKQEAVLPLMTNKQTLKLRVVWRKKARLMQRLRVQAPLKLTT